MTPQPSGHWVLDKNNPLVSRLLLAAFFTADDPTHPYDYVSGQLANTVVDITTETTSSRGVVAKFNGTTSTALFQVNLAGHQQVTVSFWLWWDANSNADAMALQYGTDWTEDHGFIVDLDSSFLLGPGQPLYAWALGSTGGRFTATWDAQFPAGEWHHHIIAFDRDNGVKGTGTNYVDGQPYSGISANNSFSTGSAFGANKNLSVMWRETQGTSPYGPLGADLFSAGRMQCLAIFDGPLSEIEARELYMNTYQLIKPVDRIFHFAELVARRQPMVWMSP